MLHWYAEHFDTVEINNTFYHLPSNTAIAGWRRETSPDFRFAVKASRYITHNRKLNNPAESLKRFMLQMTELGDQLGPILFQLPPTWQVNVERLHGFLAELPARHRYVFEFRDSSWNTPEVYRALRRHNVAFCIFDLAGLQSPMEMTADFTYIRLHGPGHAYQGNYRPTDLHNWATRIDGWQKELKDIFVYFDNDQRGYATTNAMELRQMVDGANTPAHSVGRKTA